MRGGGRGGFSSAPSNFEKIGVALKEIEDKIICKCTHQNVPILRREVYLKDKQEIGTIEDVFGNTQDIHFVIELNKGIKASSIKAETEIYGESRNMLTLD